MEFPIMHADVATAATEFRTIRDMIRYAVSRFNAAGVCYGHGTTSSWDEAVFIVLEGLKLPIDQLEPYMDARLSHDERFFLARLIETRVTTRKPASYLLRRAYMQGVPFYVDERVIVPRSYLGEILHSDLLMMGDGGEEERSVRRILDLCTGSGCLAVLAAFAFPEAKVHAVDLSADALDVARKNVRNHSLEDRITLFEGDLFSPLGTHKYDLILTNPPYVDALSMQNLPPEFRHEPTMALASGEDGMDIIKRILEMAPDYLSEKGLLVCECGTGRSVLERDCPDLDFIWLETEDSFAEVFWLTQQQLNKGKEACHKASFVRESD